MKGLVQVYTGDGKGKTTAAFGLSMRAMGRDFRVAFVQFLKSSLSGEIISGQNLSAMDIFRINQSPKFTWNMNNCELQELQSEITEGFKLVKQLAKSNMYQLIVLDEMVHVLHRNYITQSDFEQFLNDKPAHVELVLTGRNAPEWLIEVADLVTEMRCIKHPLQKGIPARIGIED